MSDTDLAGRDEPAQPPRLLIFALMSLAGAISAILTIRLCIELSPTGGVTPISVGLGLLVEACKYLFALEGLRRLQKSDSTSRLLSGAALFTLSIVLITASVAASLGYLLEMDDRREHAAVTASLEYRSTQQQLAARGEQIALLTSTAKADNAHNYRSRALKTLAQISALRQEQRALQATLARLEAQSGADHQSTFWAGLARAFPDQHQLSVAHVRLCANVALAFILELLSIALVCLWRSRPARSDLSTDTFGIQSRSMLRMISSTPALPTRGQPLARTVSARTQRHPSRGDTQEGRGDTGVHPGTDTRYQRVKERICAGLLAPTYRAVRASEQLGQGTVQRYFAKMLAEGILRRRGRSYEVFAAGKVLG